jgi:hypothetical protein
MTTPPPKEPNGSPTSRFKRTDAFFLLGIAAVIYVPILPFAPWLQTFIHSWRPELALSCLVLVVSILAFRTESFVAAVRSI